MVVVCVCVCMCVGRGGRGRRREGKGEGEEGGGGEERRVSNADQFSGWSPPVLGHKGAVRLLDTAHVLLKGGSGAKGPFQSSGWTLSGVSCQLPDVPLPARDGKSWKVTPTV